MIILIAIYGAEPPSKCNCEDLGGFFLAKVGGSKMTGTLGVISKMSVKLQRAEGWKVCSQSCFREVWEAE